MTETREEEHAQEFRPRGSGEWRLLAELPGASGDQQQAIRRNKEELHNVLLGSLQMQHLVVIAGSGCSLSAGGPSMKDLWVAAAGEEPTEAAAKVAASVHQDLNDRNIEAFLSRVESFLDIYRDEAITDFLNTSRKVILDKCSDFLQSDRLSAHKTFLHRLSRRRVRDQRLKVFTTNYDLCFERTAGELGGVALDGFSFSTPRHYDPRFFNYDIIRRPRTSEDLGNYLEGVFLLYKLHGSVNWARTKEGAIVEKEKPEPEEACLIYPARGKYQQSFRQPHLEAMAQYLAAVREPNTCVLAVGFGFNDDHLSEPLLAAARSNPHLRLIIVDPDARAKIDDAKKGNAYCRELGEIGSRDEDVWFIAASFEAFARMIPDLRSLTPADTLMKAVRDVARER